MHNALVCNFQNSRKLSLAKVSLAAKVELKTYGH